jgi:hypothetical protein
VLLPALLVDALSAIHEAELSAANDAVDIDVIERKAAIAVNRCNFFVILIAPYTNSIAKREKLVHRLVARSRVPTAIGRRRSRKITNLTASRFFGSSVAFMKLEEISRLGMITIALQWLNAAAPRRPPSNFKL